MNQLIAYCGLDCEKCDAYIATRDNDQALREKTAKLWSKLNQTTILPEQINCEGCRTDGVKTVFCDCLCSIRQCASQKELETCDACTEKETCPTLSKLNAKSPIINITIVKADITKLAVDVIVNAANTSLLGGGGVDGAIHRAAGPKLLEECRTLHGAHTGEAKMTDGYNLPAKKVIHTPGPIWNGGTHHEAENLSSCWRRSLCLAMETDLHSIAFPSISTGVYGYPLDKAAKIAMTTCVEFILNHPSYELEIIVAAFDDRTYSAYKEALNEALETAGI